MSKPDKPVIVQAPIAGLDRNYAYQSQPPYSFPDGLNIRCRDVFEQRERVGSRPCLQKAYQTLLGSGNPIRLMNVCNTLNLQNISTYGDDFSGGAMSGDWTAPSGSSLPSVSGGYARASGTPVSKRAVLTLVSTINTTSARDASILVANATNTAGASCIVMLDVLTTTVAGIRAFVTMTGDVGQHATLFLEIQNVTVASYATYYSLSPLWLKVSIDASNTVRVYWENADTPNIVYSIPGTYTPTGALAGFAIENASGEGLVDSFRLNYYSTTGSTNLPPRALVASSNGLVYYETVASSLLSVGGSVRLANDILLSSVNRLTNLYIADYGLAVQGTIGATNGGAGTTLTDATGGGVNFTTAGVNADDYRVEIISGSAGTISGIYGITSVSGTNLVLSTTPGISKTAIVYRVVRGSKIFDSSAITLALMGIGTIGNQPPLGCKIVTAWLDKLVWGKDPRNPNVAFLSRSGDPLDYLYATGDESGAFAYDPAKSAGAATIGDPITAMIPHSDDYLLFTGYKSINIQRGDPTAGGQLDVVTRDAGVVDFAAWCYTPEHIPVALGYNGLFMFTPGPSATPVDLSKGKLPQELIGVDPSLYFVQLSYSVRDDGIYVSVTPKTAGNTTHWFFSWTRKAFYPAGYSSTKEATAQCVHDVGASGNPVALFGDRDGYIRQHINGAANDDGTSVSSNVLLGPFALGAPVYDGVIHEVLCALARQSNPVLVEVLVGTTAEEARYAAAFDSFTMVAGRNPTYRCKARGGACFLRLSSSLPWTLESLALIREIVGIQRT